MVIANRLQDVREEAQKRDFQRAKKKAKLEEAGGRVALLREKAQQAVKPARMEARGAAQEARKLADQNIRDVAVIGGKSAAAGARDAARAASKASARAADAAPTVDYSAPGTRRPTGGTDDAQAMFERAQNAATAAPPTDATLDPLSGPEQLGDFVTGPTQTPGDTQVRGPAVDMLVVGPPADKGGMAELVLSGGGGRDDPGMEAFVTGSGQGGQQPRDEASMAAFVTGRNPGGDD